MSRTPDIGEILARPRPVQQDVHAFLVFLNDDDALDDYVEAELAELCQTAGYVPSGMARQRRKGRYDTATCIGSGKAEELLPQILDAGAQVVIFDDELSAIQQRNLEKMWERRVMDRTQLILDIFAQRARTREGKLQVELAQLSYSMPRLMSVYTQFEQQQGGIGVRGGAGETKIEADRRKVRDRINDLRREIEEVRKQRALQRAGRKRLPWPMGSLVGYTSAGKSTLLNRLTGSNVLADPMLFATLDPTTRKVALPDGWGILLSDTVGFIRNLPHHLVAAFHATLEEVTDADFLIHVVDVSNPEFEIQHDAVLEVLEQLQAGSKPVITAYNKIDRVHDRPLLTRLVADTPDTVAISAQTGEGLDDLIDRIVHLLHGMLRRVEVLLPYDSGAVLNQCHEQGRVHEMEYRADGILLSADVTPDLAGMLQARYGATVQNGLT